MSKDQSKKNLSRVNVKKKVWYRIVGPKMFSTDGIGRDLLIFSGRSLGRTVKINLKDISGNVKDQNAYVCFKLDAVGRNCVESFRHRVRTDRNPRQKLVRKNTDRIDDYFALTTKEGKNIVIKTLIITQSKSQRSVRGQLRKN